MPNNGIPVVVGAIAGIALTQILAPAVLGLVGFSAAGPVASTLAAVIQSGIGNVVAGSAFATAQSAVSKNPCLERAGRAIQIRTSQQPAC